MGTTPASSRRGEAGLPGLSYQSNLNPTDCPRDRLSGSTRAEGGPNNGREQGTARLERRLEHGRERVDRLQVLPGYARCVTRAEVDVREGALAMRTHAGRELQQCGVVLAQRLGARHRSQCLAVLQSRLELGRVAVEARQSGYRERPGTVGIGEARLTVFLHALRVGDGLFDQSAGRAARRYGSHLAGGRGGALA